MPKVVKKPTQKRAAKPPTVTGYHWRRHAAGWDLRKDVYVTSHDGERKRKQPYLAHMSREAFNELAPISTLTCLRLGFLRPPAGETCGGSIYRGGVLNA